jgi:hypothetical protein
MLVSVISLGHHLLSGWDQFRVRARAARTAGIDTLDAQPSRRAALLAKIADTKKTCIAHALAVLVAIFEARCIINRSPAGTLLRSRLGLNDFRDSFLAMRQDLPMATLTIVFIVRVYDIPVAVLLSLVTSSIMLGMKLDKLTMLKHWCAQGVIAGFAIAVAMVISQVG